MNEKPISPKTKEIIQRYKTDYKHYFKKCLKIRDKQSQVIPFITNGTQNRIIHVVEEWQKKYPDLLTRPTLYIITLKARQEGVSTVTEGIFFHDLNFNKDMAAMVISYDEDSAVHIADMASRFYQYMPQVIKPASRPYRGKGLLFENHKFNSNKPVSDSNHPGLQNKFLIETARNLFAGSSFTIMRLHISELAKWPNPEATMTSLMQAVPDRGAIVLVESTANGLNFFYELWQKAEAGENNFTPLFFPWWEHKEYQLDFINDKEKERFKDSLDTFSREDSVDYKELMTTYNLTYNQMAWYRKTLRDKCNGDVNTMRQEYPCCAEESFIASGSPVFDNQKVLNRKKLLERLYKEESPLVGDIISRTTPDGDPVKGTETFKPNINGNLTIFKQPEPGVPYVIGADTSEGVGGDYSVGQVIDNTTGHQVAAWRGQIDSDQFGKVLFSLGHYYNEALINIEANFDLTPIHTLERLHYRRIYRREVIDSITNQKQQKHGFKTTKTTRPVIINNLVELVREEVEAVNCLVTLSEMLTFVKNTMGKPEAQEGEHDDTVLALALAHAARDQQKTVRDQPKKIQLSGTYSWGELLMLGHKPYQIRRMVKHGEIRLIGRMPSK